MFRNEVQPQCVIGSTVVIGKVNSMRFAAAHLGKDVAKCALMARFAVHDHPVHVEYDGLNCVHRRANTGSEADRQTEARRMTVAPFPPMTSESSLLFLTQLKVL